MAKGGMLMDDLTIFCAGSTRSVRYAADILSERGINIVHEPCDAATYVLLDIPSLGPSDKLRDGSDLRELIAAVPDEAVYIGGGLENPLLERHKKYDLLKKEGYLKENARITAYCALHIIGTALPVTLEDCPVLIIGWGRIGKVLTSLLVRLGAHVTVASRDIRSIASLSKLGISAVLTDMVSPQKYRLILNTAPASVLTESSLSSCVNTVKIDLASVKGLAGDDVIWARGLPGQYAPESSGQLIARYVLNYLKEDIP